LPEDEKQYLCTFGKKDSDLNSQRAIMTTEASGADGKMNRLKKLNPAAKYLLIKQNPSPVGLSESKSAKIVRSE